MYPVRRLSELSSFTANQFAIMTPIITLAILAACAVQLSWMGWVIGLPPAEVALPVSGGVVLLAVVALYFAAIACFGGWCLSHSKTRFVRAVVRPWAHRLLKSLAASPLRSYSHPRTVVDLMAIDGLSFFSSSRRRMAVPNPATLSGASPLLEYPFLRNTRYLCVGRRSP